MNISQHVALTEMAAAVKRETNGRLEITMIQRHAGGAWPMLAITARRLQMLDMSHSVYATVVPAAQIDSVGFSFRSSEQVWRALDGALGAWVRKEFAAKGILAFEKTFESGFRQTTSTARPIRTVEDFGGLRIRTIPAPVFVELFKAFGASPVPVDPSELYTALQTHIADAQESPLQAIETYRLFEVQKYLSVTNHVWAGDWLTMNMAAWNALPPDIQAVLERNVRTYTLKQRRAAQVYGARSATSCAVRA